MIAKLGMGRLWAGVALALLLAGPARGGAALVWDLASADDFASAKGLKGLSLHRSGRVLLAPKQVLVPGLDELLVTALAADGKGSVFVGTGVHGRIFRIDPAFKAAQVWQIAEPIVTSLAVDPSGNVYAAAGATGKIYKLAFAAGKPKPQVSVLCDLDNEYVWAMAFDRAGRLLVAASLPAALYAVDPTGKAAKIADLGDGHLSALAMDAKGNMYTASEPDAIVYRVTPKGQVRVLYDAQEEGVRCLVVDPQGQVLIGTGGGMPATRRVSRRGPVARLTIVAAKANNAVKPPPKSPAAAAKFKGAPSKPNAVYRIHPDGRVKKVFSPGNAYVFAMAFDSQGRLLVVTGNEGKLYRVDANDEVTDLIDREESQVMAALPLPSGEVLLGTGNQGRVVRVATTPSETGAMESAVLDAAFLATWGRVWWEADVPKGASLTLATRSGNSAKPDKTWSGYSAELARPAGSKVASPRGRYLQLRVTFEAPKGSESPVLRRVRIAYLPDNQPPQITSLTVTQDGQPAKAKSGKDGQKAAANPSPTSAKVEWKATDPNGDQMQFKMQYRGEDEKRWKDLKGQFPNAFSFLWDTDRVPDGVYRIKLTANDSPSNPQGQRLSVDKVSEPVIVDNTRPVVSKIATRPLPGGKCTVSGTVKDTLSYIKSLQYSVDAGDWVSFSSSDRILDSPSEKFSFTIEKLKPGEHTIVVVARDSSGNMGSAKAVVTTK